MDICENPHRMLEPVLVKGLTWDHCDFLNSLRGANK